MTRDYVQLANDVSTGVRLLRQAIPDAMKGFGGLAVAATVTDALDSKTKELMAVAIAIAIQCDGCVAIHTKLAHKHGASRKELAETIALAIYMGGGPASVYGAEALRAYDQFNAKQETASE